MKTLKALIAYFIISLTFFTCTKPYTIDFKNIDKRIVVNSLFEPDSVIKIFLTEEASLAEDVFPDNFKRIEDAKILIYEDGVIVDTAYYVRDGNYRTKIKPKTEVKYKIKINTPDYTNIVAEDIIPEPIKIDSLNITKNNQDYYQYTVKVFFTDPVDIENFYFLSVNWKQQIDTISWWEEAYITTEDPAIGEWLTQSFQVPIFNDEIFDGTTYTLTFDIQVNELNINRGPCIIDIASISKNMYLFMKSYNEQTPAFGDDLLGDFQQGLMEPIPIYTNIEGGLGIFAGYSISSDTLHFE